MDARQKTLEQVEALIVKGRQAIATQFATPRVSGGVNIDTAISAGWRSQTLTFLTNLFGKDSDYLDEFRVKTERYYRAESVEDGVGILRSVREDIQNGHLQSYRQLIEAGLLGGLMGQAEYLLEKSYLVAAAAVAGAALQQGLEELAKRHDLKLNKRENLDSLADKLLQAKAIDGIARRQLSLIASVRNAADHGKVEELNKERVEGMVSGSVDFLAKHAT